MVAIAGAEPIGLPRLGGGAVSFGLGPNSVGVGGGGGSGSAVTGATVAGTGSGTVGGGPTSVPWGWGGTARTEEPASVDDGYRFGYDGWACGNPFSSRTTSGTGGAPAPPSLGEPDIFGLC